ncbi:major outer membrane protein [Campylobacter devanensis]|uniref:major outer membrane protein n=1 Tax=Campylobacter devanensis TaxID=3161138 RepID=UPI000A342DD2|nr:major outer membrane protein [Campylobacter sp. P0136]
MKLVKLSLFAIISVATISSVSNAKTLEETIKNIDISGYSRYRYDIYDSEYDILDINRHRFTSEINVQSALDDNFFGVIGFRYDSGDNSGQNYNAATQVGTKDTGFSYDNYGQTFNVRQFYLGYKAGNTTITAGRQVLGTFFTDDMVGTGIKVLNNDINGLTLTGMAFDNLQNDSDILTNYFLIGKKNYKQPEYVTDRNLYSVAAIGSYDLVSFQLWYAAIDSVAQLYATDLLIGTNIADIDLSLQAQYAASSMWAENFGLKGVPLDDAKFAAIEAGAKAFGFDANAGYVWFDTDKVSLISFEDQGSFIDAGEDILEYPLITGEGKHWFLKAGYTFANKVRVGADYVSGEVTHKLNNSTTNKYETVARVDYKYSKKLNFKAWYSYINRDSDPGDYKHLRFEARYNF